ncbi:BamA/TamA family outer membrane protein [Fibrella forsythiae]|uniref:BamA/TamA family outer membrane protein n=1 Tax=Fibrella forsythiae TaxID=2817061 RepID=A0ABS3JQ23_9BACT|nr:BamA/TamA family outer membrane protein [Fibrella forsythiae]MBO0952087.1 BamA/TamA family outer membrane protein [Fibrella forsythiae]
MSLFTFIFSLWQLTAVPAPADSAVVVRSVKLVGNARTRDRIIFREMAIHTGDTLRRSELPKKIAWDQRKIWNTNLFISVDVAAVEDSTAPPENRPVDITVTMKERWYIFVVPIFELADRNLNEWWYDRGHDLRRTNYGLQLSWKNFTGRNDKLTAVAQTGFTPKYIMSYDRPYIDKAQRIGANADFYYATNREIAYRPFRDKWEYIRPDGLNMLRTRLTTSIGITRRDGFYNFHELEARYTNNTIADTVASLNPDYFLDGRTRQQFLTLTYNYRYDRRDNVAYALQGTLLTAMVAHSGWMPNADLTQTDLLVGVSRYYPLGKRFFAANTVRLRNVWATRQPYFTTRGLGVGDDVIRGYELYVIEGNRYGVFRNNIRFRLFDVKKEWKWIPIRQFNTVPIAAYLSLIADAGYVNSTIAEKYQSRLANRWLYSGGLSLDVVTYYNMVFRFSTVVNAQRETGFFLNIQREL